MLIRDLRRLGAPRIDHHQLSAARLHRLRLAAEVRHRPQAAVRHHRIRSDHHQQIRARQVRHRDRQPVAEHQPGRQLLRHLIERRRREQVRRSDRPGQPRRVQRQPELVHRRIADHHRHRIPPVLLQDRHQPPLDLRERLVPRHLDMLAVSLHQRRAQPIRILVQIAQRRRLRTQKARRVHIGLVPADRRDPALVDLQLEPAARFAERTDAIHNAGHGATLPRSRQPVAAVPPTAADSRQRDYLGGNEAHAAGVCRYSADGSASCRRAAARSTHSRPPA